MPATTVVVSLLSWLRHFLRHISWKTSNVALLDNQACLVIFNVSGPSDSETLQNV